MQTNDLLEHANAERILAEGWKLFQEKGYRGVTVDELCLRCEITKPTLYYYFHDKENLFVQILMFKLHGFREIIEQPGSLPQRLQRIALSILDSFQTEYTSMLRDRQHLKSVENLQAIRDAFRGELFNPLNELMRSGIAAGRLTAENPETLTLIFLGIVNNFIGKADEMKTDHASLSRKLTGYFLQGVMNHESKSDSLV
jgi:AcrR family transcriptional regulator